MEGNRLSNCPQIWYLTVCWWSCQAQSCGEFLMMHVISFASRMFISVISSSAWFTLRGNVGKKYYFSKFHRILLNVPGCLALCWWGNFRHSWIMYRVFKNKIVSNHHQKQTRFAYVGKHLIQHLALFIMGWTTEIHSHSKPGFIFVLAIFSSKGKCSPFLELTPMI